MTLVTARFHFFQGSHSSDVTIFILYKFCISKPFNLYYVINLRKGLYYQDFNMVAVRKIITAVHDNLPCTIGSAETPSINNVTKST